MNSLKIQIKRIIKRINKQFLTKRYLINLLSDKRFSALIQNPVPKSEEDDQAWTWFQTMIAFKGDPFLYKLGPFSFKVEQLTKEGLITLSESLSNGASYESLIALTKPSNQPAKILFKYNLFKYFIRNYIPLEALNGILSEFWLFCTSKKKSIWDIGLNGIIPREKKGQLIYSPKMNSSVSAMVLQKLGPEIFGIPTSLQ